MNLARVFLLEAKNMIRGWLMRWMKMTLIAGLVIILSLLIGGGFSESIAQSTQTLDLSKPKLRDRIQSAGSITSKPIPSWGSIVGSKDDAVNLTEGEGIYLKLEPGKQVLPGDRFSIVRLGEVITHPVTKKIIGNLVWIPGELTILEAKDRVVTAKITKSYRSVNQGDLIIPAQPVLPETMPLRNLKKIEGNVLIALEEEENITEAQFIFIDRGSNEGVILGDLFSIYQLEYFSQETMKDKNLTLPLAKVGEAVIISVQEETSTALVTHSSKAIYVGDRAVSGQE
jgi:hypothetical protein